MKWPGLTNSLFLSRSRRCFSSLKFVRTSIWPCNCMVNYDLSLQEMLVFSSNSESWHSIWRASWYASNCVHFKKQSKFLIYFFNFVSTYIYLNLASFLISISIVGKVLLDIIGHIKEHRMRLIIAEILETYRLKILKTSHFKNSAFKLLKV